MVLKNLKIFLLFLLLIFFPSQSLYASDSDAFDQVFVSRVIDGDTIVVKFSTGQKEKVRLIGIDTPETKHPRKPIQYFGKEASEYTKKHLLNKNVKLTYDWQRRDRYGRILAYIWVNGKLFNLQIIRDGYAFAYLKYPFHDDYMEKFRQAERYARKNKLGLWENGD